MFPDEPEFCRDTKVPKMMMSLSKLTPGTTVNYDVRYVFVPLSSGDVSDGGTLLNSGSFMVPSLAITKVKGLTSNNSMGEGRHYNLKAESLTISGFIVGPGSAEVLSIDMNTRKGEMRGSTPIASDTNITKDGGFTITYDGAGDTMKNVGKYTRVLYATTETDGDILHGTPEYITIHVPPKSPHNANSLPSPDHSSCMTSGIKTERCYIPPVPASLSDLRAVAGDGLVHLSWTPAEEIDHHAIETGKFTYTTGVDKKTSDDCTYLYKCDPMPSYTSSVYEKDSYRVILYHERHDLDLADHQVMYTLLDGHKIILPWKEYAKEPFTSGAITVGGLENGKQYAFKVAGVNGYGVVGPHTDPVFATPLNESSPVPIVEITKPAGTVKTDMLKLVTDSSILTISGEVTPAGELVIMDSDKNYLGHILPAGNTDQTKWSHTLQNMQMGKYNDFYLESRSSSDSDIRSIVPLHVQVAYPDDNGKIDITNSPIPAYLEAVPPAIRMAGPDGVPFAYPSTPLPDGLIYGGWSVGVSKEWDGTVTVKPRPMKQSDPGEHLPKDANGNADPPSEMSYQTNADSLTLNGVVRPAGELVIRDGDMNYIRHILPSGNTDKTSWTYTAENLTYDGITVFFLESRPASDSYTRGEPFKLEITHVDCDIDTSPICPTVTWNMKLPDTTE